MRIEDWMAIGRNRAIRRPKFAPSRGAVIDIGAGKRPVPGAIPFDRPGWEAGAPIPCSSDTVSLVWMNGFVDYLDDAELHDVLSECARVLVDGGLINVVVPHGMAELSATDPAKKTRWSEKSWRNFLDNPHWDARGSSLPFVIHTQFILGIAWRNLSLFTQLERTAR